MTCCFPVPQVQRSAQGLQGFIVGHLNAIQRRFQLLGSILHHFLEPMVIPLELQFQVFLFQSTLEIANYRVDVFAKTDVFYYKGSSSLTDTGLGYATFSVAGVTLSGATVVAALYPTSVGQPGAGSSSAQLPGGWLAHPNTGVGKKLANYKAQVYSKTDIDTFRKTTSRSSFRTPTTRARGRA